jgi:transcriptional regulator with XRE-family HTH domain
MSDAEQGRSAGGDHGPVTSRAMGVRRLGNALKKARGRMSQQAAAEAWGVALSTLGAIEQGVDRKYQPPTLAPFDAVLGREGAAWDLYNQPEEAGWDVPAASLVLVEDLRGRIEELEETVATLTERLNQPPSPLDAARGQLSADEVSELVAYAHFMLIRRERNRFVHGLRSDRP